MVRRFIAAQLNADNSIECGAMRKARFGERTGVEDGKITGELRYKTNLRVAQPAIIGGCGGGADDQSVEFMKLAPQHLGLEVRRVPGERASRRFERFAQTTSGDLPVLKASHSS